MKRKLPSQKAKLEEELVEKPAAGAPIKEGEHTPLKTEAEAAPVPEAPVVAPMPPEEKANTVVEAPPEEEITSLGEVAPEVMDVPPVASSSKKEQAEPPQPPQPLDDPFVHSMVDEEAMVMDAPPTRRPGREDVNTAAPEDPPHRHRSVSAEEILAEAAPSPLADEDKSVDDLFDADHNAAPTKEGGPAAPEEDEDAWDLGDLVDIPPEHAQVGGSPFSTPQEEEGKTSSSSDAGASAKASEGAPPWQQPAKGGRRKPVIPKLPKAIVEDSSKMGVVISFVLVVLLVGGTALFYKNRDTAVEKISRWTGTLDEVGQPVPTLEQTDASQEALEVESVVQAKTFEKTAPAPLAQEPKAAQLSTVDVQVLDVRPDEASQPIVADEKLQMPDDVDKFSALQEAIARKRSERREQTAAKLNGEAKDLDPDTLPPEEVTRRNMEIIRETNASLKEYRKALAGVNDPALKPRPGQFLRAQRGEAPLAAPQAALRPPPQAAPAPELYGNPVVEDLADLVTQKPQESGVRKLQDFDVSLFEPRRNRVSIPKGVSPRLSAEDFPPLEVLSFVAGQGIIGKARGKEGVLLLGEALEGWELVAVFNSYAEFQKDGKKRIVTFNNANR